MDRVEAIKYRRYTEPLRCAAPRSRCALRLLELSVDEIVLNVSRGCTLLDRDAASLELL